MKRVTLMAKVGEHYMGRNGIEYVCLKDSPFYGRAIFQAVKSKWTFLAIGCGQYEDGSIDWDMSTGGYFEENN